MRRIELLQIISENARFYNFLIANGLIVQKKCDRCSYFMQLNLQTWEFRCNKTFFLIRCNTKKSYFEKNNPLYACKLDIQTLILIIYEFSRNTRLVDFSHEYDVANSTVSIFYKKLRAKLVGFYVNNEPSMIGGPGVIVEWDECLLVKNKNHRGRILQNQQWVFGGVVIGSTTQCFVEIISDRTTFTLANVVRRRILPGTIINSDLRPAYPGILRLLPEYELTLQSVNHSLNFIDPETGAHTQSIEGFWSVLKRSLRRHGTNFGGLENLMLKIHEIIARRIYAHDLFLILLRIILSND